ncbi:hypothetical protein [Solitalea canadensis]|uniref:Uncharacterized protein n=1 Tax=Solitalea canadensis (strain ATCC 29591 / DSM 3403 / JCM 21819 / LMG 8368 / NBRC 15130 / NCIMB 12057 / USAM 9D) TaxID=929556 RepID=H8KSP3_SOLCM|nr:hypothetical protein [Solitalea canadensis]AFD05187.1 hypothetical protein Solca_0022 [Solitalea canadensis DSM 3403]
MKRITLTLSLLLFTLGVTTSCQDVTEVTEVYTTPARSILYNVAANSWTPYGGNSGYTTSLNVPEITGSFNEYGGILVYIAFGTAAPFEALPKTLDGISYNFTTFTGSIELDFQTVSGGAMTRPGFLQAKVVLVDAEQIALLKAKGVDLKNYNAVMSTVKPIERSISVKVN